MPLYMDIHTVDSDSFSVEDVVKAHMQDLAIQDKFGVTQLKYWVNEDSKTLFCLMKGPDKEACNQVHKESHGDTACNIIEVSDNEYNIFMGVGTDVNDLAHTESGEIDTGYRTIALVKLSGYSRNKNEITEKAHELIKQHNGSLILEPNNSWMVSFIFASDALFFANSLAEFLTRSAFNIEYNMAISSGRPVDEQGNDMFEETKKKVQALSSLGYSNTIYLDVESQILSDKELNETKPIAKNCRVVKYEDLNLAIDLASVLNNNLAHSKFSSQDLTMKLHLSKSQANRKIKLLTGFAPNQLIQEFRLQTALTHIKQGEKSVAEIAYASGFNSPTYFTRTFKKRFGESPSDFLKRQS